LDEYFKRIPAIFKIDSDDINTRIQQSLKHLEVNKSNLEAQIREEKDKYNKTIEA
jgi:hypothetical protein